MFFNIKIEMGPVNSSDSDLPVNSITQGLPGCLSTRPEPWPCLNSKSGFLKRPLGLFLPVHISSAPLEESLCSLHVTPDLKMFLYFLAI